MTTIRVKSILVIIACLGSSLYTTFRKRDLVFRRKKQRRNLPVGPFESAIFGHWMTIVTD
jgi:hypothetical protein